VTAAVTAAGLPVVDPAGLNERQLAGAACVSCGKRWPRPRRAVGVLPGGGRVYACPECAPQLELAIEARALDGAWDVGGGPPADGPRG
jgi:hypothetical protein